MIDMIVQSMATIILLLGIWFMGNGVLLGPLLGALSELLFVYIGITNHVWSIAIVGIVIFFIQARNFYKWFFDEYKPWI